MSESWSERLTREHNARAMAQLAARKIPPCHLPRPAYVYLGQLADGLHKIGYTTRLRARQAEIRTDFRDPGFLIIWSALGGPDMEVELHRAFAAIRIGNRELFKFPGRDAVAEVAAAYRRLMESR
jgi:hypothetical protein